MKVSGVCGTFSDSARHVGAHGDHRQCRQSLQCDRMEDWVVHRAKAPHQSTLRHAPELCLYLLYAHSGNAMPDEAAPTSSSII